MRPIHFFAMALGALALGCTSSSDSSGTSGGRSVALDDYVPGPLAMRRLTKAQYLSSIHALFGDDLDVFPPTEVDTRVDGLLSLGANAATITPAGIERYEATARQVAEIALSAERRGRLLSCAPEVASAPDDDCARELVDGLAPLVLRRALRPGESDAYVALARASAEDLGGFYEGLESLLSSWLLSPDFLFIQERAAPNNPERTEAGLALAGDTLASRLSYFLWNSGPDPELLEAATSGVLETDEGYEAQVARMVGNEARLEDGIRALFRDLYELDALDSVAKDTASFPQYTKGVIDDAKEQTLRTIVDHLLVRREDYRDLFTTRRTFMTKNLGPIYGVPVTEDWEPYVFDEGGARAGILSHVSFLARNARSARSSPILRGKFVLDSLLCTPVPAPPATVNFEALAPENGLGDTARERLEIHREDPACAPCHNLMDPIGLALENFDAIGQFRTLEGGFPIETYGQIDGVEYGDVTGFYSTLRDNPKLSSCMVRKLYMHAVGRLTEPSENELLVALQEDFAASGHDFVELMKTISLTHGFRSTSGTRDDAPSFEEASP